MQSTRLTVRRRVADANSRHVYATGVVQRDVRYGRGSTSVAATLHEIPQVFAISLGKVEAIEVDVPGNGHSKERMTSNGGIYHDSCSKRHQRSKSSSSCVWALCNDPLPPERVTHVQNEEHGYTETIHGQN